MSLSHTIQYAHKGIILLTINLIQLNRHIVNIRQRLTTKKIRSRISIAQHRLIFRSNHRSKLRQVANHQQLHTAKRLTPIAEVAQHGIHSVQQVAAHHRNLINDNHIERSNNLSFLLAKVKHRVHLSARKIRRQWKLEERMNSNAACIYGSHTSRSKHNSLLATLFHHRAQECCFTSPRFSCQENATPSILYKVPCLTKLYILFHDVRLYYTL